MAFDSTRDTHCILQHCPTYFTVHSKQIWMHKIILSAAFKDIISLSTGSLQHLFYID